VSKPQELKPGSVVTKAVATKKDGQLRPYFGVAVYIDEKGRKRHQYLYGGPPKRIRKALKDR
jgi:hypothetical protein